MEQRIVRKVNDHLIDFKSDIGEWIKRYNCSVKRDEDDVTSAFLQYVYSYNNPNFTEDDFQKRKRTTATIPPNERCIAKRSNNEQCSRRRKEGGCYCGTHAKGTPRGVVCQLAAEETSRKVEIRTIEINGIYYYVDNENKVYSPEDIVAGFSSPRVIGKYTNEKFERLTQYEKE